MARHLSSLTPDEIRQRLIRAEEEAEALKALLRVRMRQEESRTRVKQALSVIGEEEQRKGVNGVR